jgi:hypothetical protein
VTDLKASSTEIDERGFAIVPKVIGDKDIEAIISELARLPVGKSSRGGQMYAARNLLSTVPALAKLARATEILRLAEGILGDGAFPIRGILFDKVPSANWHVAWHQDQVIPVAQRRDVAGFSSWSIKERSASRSAADFGS